MLLENPSHDWSIKRSVLTVTDQRMYFWVLMLTRPIYVLHTRFFSEELHCINATWDYSYSKTQENCESLPEYVLLSFTINTTYKKSPPSYQFIEQQLGFQNYRITVSQKEL